MRGLPAPHHLPKFAQLRVYCICDAIQPPHPLTPSSPALSLSCIRDFSSELGIRIRWPKYWSFSFSINPSSEYPGLISLKINGLLYLSHDYPTMLRVFKSILWRYRRNKCSNIVLRENSFGSLLTCCGITTMFQILNLFTCPPAHSKVGCKMASPVTQCVHTQLLHSCLTLCDCMDCSPPGSSVHGILQARILEWVAISASSRGIFRPRAQTHVSCISWIIGRFLTTEPPGKPPPVMWQGNSKWDWKRPVFSGWTCRTNVPGKVLFLAPLMLEGLIQMALPV